MISHSIAKWAIKYILWRRHETLLFESGCQFFEMKLHVSELVALGQDLKQLFVINVAFCWS